ncbi:imelysin family protein [Psychrobacter pygoscelis]|uniref:imelysin family protein n=1 Tax=Psychrobacter pygoscelis TaxID=2488563 RepID=UPI00103B5B41|nr:imelysin family protein [Psychrobacter pygoscelis]
MKKHHAIAMVLSAISAGVLISCTKPSDEPNSADTEPTQSEASSTEPTTPAQSATNTAESTNTAATPSTSATGTGTAVTVSAETQQTYLTHVANDLIIPAYHDAIVQSDMLNTLAKKHCAAGSVQGTPLKELRGQWIKLAQAWASAEMINFGPATQSMSNLYINYYPDERGLVHNGVADLISANPNLTSDQLAQESAIVQGVPGLEEALFANDSLSASQCAYVISASEALSIRLKNIETTWKENSVSLLAIDKTASSDQGLNQWVNSLLSLIETLKSSAVDQPLGLTGNPKGHVPAATAGQSRAIINAKIATLNKALTDPVLTAILQGNDTGNAVGDKLSSALSETSTLLAQMPDDITKADKDTQQKLYNHLTEVTQVIKRELIPALGIRVGFNSTDGD